MADASDIVDFAASKDIESLEKTFGELMALRTQAVVDRTQAKLATAFSFAKSTEGE